MLDRVLRATNKTAQRNAGAFVETKFEQNFTCSERSFLESWIDLPQWESTEDEEQKKKGSTSGKKRREACQSRLKWEIATERWEAKEEITPQTSIYATNVDAAEMLQSAPHLMYARETGADAYETALAILHYVGCRPSVVYDKILYSSNHKEINWTKLHWEDKEEPNLSECSHQTST